MLKPKRGGWIAPRTKLQFPQRLRCSNKNNPFPIPSCNSANLNINLNISLNSLTVALRNHWLWIKYFIVYINHLDLKTWLVVFVKRFLCLKITCCIGSVTSMYISKLLQWYHQCKIQSNIFLWSEKGCSYPNTTSQLFSAYRLFILSLCRLYSCLLKALDEVRRSKTTS